MRFVLQPLGLHSPPAAADNLELFRSIGACQKRLSIRPGVRRRISAAPRVEAGFYVVRLDDERYETVDAIIYGG